MESFIIRALQLILSLSILVIVHEFGHFLFARLFKIRVEKFYLFFDAGFKLFKYKPKNSDTEYGIGWIPLGGYVKISGMIDESMDKEQMAKPPQAWEFRSKPAWQRLLVMVGGVLFNFILAIFIYSMILFASGDSYIKTQDIAVNTEFSDIAKKAGFKDGDVLVGADGQELVLRDSRTLDMNTLIAILNAKEVSIIREGKNATITMPEGFMDEFVAAKEGFWSFDIPTVVKGVIEGSEAQKAGLQQGDRIIGINDDLTSSYPVFRKELADCKGSDIDILILRDNKEMRLQAKVDTVGTLGFWVQDSMLDLFSDRVTHQSFSFFESFPAGVNLGVQTLTGYIAQMKLVFTKEGVKNIGSFGVIGSMFSPSWDWHAFWMMTAFLSIILAVMNILPIPALDGGHVMFLLYEVIARRKPNEKFYEYAQIVGMVLLFALMIYAVGNDIFRFLF